VRQRQPVGRDNAVAGKQNRPGTGYIGFLAEVPAEMKTLDIECHGQAALRLKADFLKALTAPLDKARDAKTTSILIEGSASPEAIISAAAVKRLGQWQKTAPTPSAADTNKQNTPSDDKIEQALLKAT